MNIKCDIVAMISVIVMLVTTTVILGDEMPQNYLIFFVEMIITILGFTLWEIFLYRRFWSLTLERYDDLNLKYQFCRGLIYFIEVLSMIFLQATWDYYGFVLQVSMFLLICAVILSVNQLLWACGCFSVSYRMCKNLCRPRTHYRPSQFPWEHESSH